MERPTDGLAFSPVRRGVCSNLVFRPVGGDAVAHPTDLEMKQRITESELQPTREYTVLTLRVTALVAVPGPRP